MMRGEEMELLDRGSVPFLCPCLCITVAVATALGINSMSWLSRDSESLWKFQELEPEKFLG